MPLLGLQQVTHLTGGETESKAEGLGADLLSPSSVLFPRSQEPPLGGGVGWPGICRLAGCGVLEEKGRGGAGLPGKWDLSLQQQRKASSFGWEEGHPPSAPPPGQDTSSTPPPPTSQALSCISCKHGHFLWRAGGGEWGLAVLGPRPVACQPRTQWLALGSGWPLHTPGLPWDPEKCHPWLELDSPMLPCHRRAEES